MEQLPSRCPYPTLVARTSGYLKQAVYSKSIQDLGHFMLNDAVAFITPDIIVRLWQETEYRREVCRPPGIGSSLCTVV
jgi:hypothetical protein